MDTLLIALQPVAKDNRWTCGDLLKVVRKLVSQPEAHPCWSEGDLAARRSAMALPPLPAGVGPTDGLPAGFDVAVAVCPPLPGGQPLWS